MQITESDFKKIVKYISNELIEKHLLPVIGPNGKPYNAVSKSTLLSLSALVSLRECLASLGEKKEKKKVTIEFTPEFEKWWKEYPTMDFIFRGKRFTGTRILKENKERCFIRYQEIIAVGNFTHEQLLNSLKVEVQARKIASFRHTHPHYNDFQFMKASMSYLNSGAYKNYINRSLQKIDEDETTNSA